MIKENINKIDYDLKNLFESVKISEKSNKGNYFFEVVASSKKAQVRVEISKPELNNNVVKWSYYVNPINESSDKIERISNIENTANDIFEILSKKKMDSAYFESLESNEDIQLINESVEFDNRFEKAYSDPNGKFNYWDIVKDIIDEDGWVYSKNSPHILDAYFSNNTGKEIEFQKSYEGEWKGSRWRPKELSEKTLTEKVSDILKKFQIEEKLVEESKANLDGDKPEKTLVFKKELRASEKFNLDTELKSIGVEYVSFVDDIIKVKI